MVRVMAVSALPELQLANSRLCGVELYSPDFLQLPDPLAMAKSSAREFLP